MRARQLHYLAREYPDPNYPIHKKLHGCFLAHVGKDEQAVQQGIEKAEYIKKGEEVGLKSGFSSKSEMQHSPERRVLGVYSACAEARMFQAPLESEYRLTCPADRTELEMMYFLRKYRTLKKRYA